MTDIYYVYNDTFLIILVRWEAQSHSDRDILCITDIKTYIMTDINMSVNHPANRKHLLHHLHSYQSMQKYVEL